MSNGRHKRGAKVRRRDTSRRNTGSSHGRSRSSTARNTGGRDMGDGRRVSAVPQPGAAIDAAAARAAGEAPNPPRRRLRITPPPELEPMAAVADRIDGPPGDLARMLVAASQARLATVEVMPSDERRTLDAAGIGVVVENPDGATFAVRWQDGSVTDDMTAAELMDWL